MRRFNLFKIIPFKYFWIKIIIITDIWKKIYIINKSEIKMFRKYLLKLKWSNFSENTNIYIKAK